MKARAGPCDALELVEPTRWRFHLRRGVKFHNGQRLHRRGRPLLPRTAPATRTGQVGYRYGGVTDVIAVDDYTVDMVSEKPNPSSSTTSSTSTSWTRDWAEEHGTTIPAAMGATGEAYANVHANGTGPFQVVRRVRTWRRSSGRSTVGGARSGTTSRRRSSGPSRRPYAGGGASVRRAGSHLPVPIQDVARVERKRRHVRAVRAGEPFAVPDAGISGATSSCTPTSRGATPLPTPGAQGVYQAIDIEAIIPHRDARSGDPGPRRGPLADGLRYPHHLERHPFDTAGPPRPCWWRPAIRTASASPSTARTTATSTTKRYARPLSRCWRRPASRWP